MTTKKKVNEWKTTIEPELLQAWKSKRMTTDVNELVELTGRSKTVIDRALTYGYVNNNDVVETITKFYVDRALKQKEQAELINGKNQ